MTRQRVTSVAGTGGVVRPELPPLPDRIAALPVDGRGYPVPWFVAWIDGKPDFRVVAPGRVVEAVRSRRCWVCGGSLGRFVAYTAGPMCTVNRVSAEPPSHRDCAIFAAQGCPFLSRPHMRRREAGLPEGGTMPGIAVLRNPGVAVVWVTTTRKPFSVDGGVMFDIGEPIEALWFAEGRDATRSEVLAAMESGLPLLRERVDPDDADAVRELEAMVAAALELVPA